MTSLKSLLENLVNSIFHINQNTNPFYPNLNYVKIPIIRLGIVFGKVQVPKTSDNNPDYEFGHKTIKFPFTFKTVPQIFLTPNDVNDGFYVAIYSKPLTIEGTDVSFVRNRGHNPSTTNDVEICVLVIGWY